MAGSVKDMSKKVGDVPAEQGVMVAKVQAKYGLVTTAKTEPVPKIRRARKGHPRTW